MYDSHYLIVCLYKKLISVSNGGRSQLSEKVHIVCLFENCQNGQCPPASALCSSNMNNVMGADGKKFNSMKILLKNNPAN